GRGGPCRGAAHRSRVYPRSDLNMHKSGKPDLWCSRRIPSLRDGMLLTMRAARETCTLGDAVVGRTHGRVGKRKTTTGRTRIRRRAGRVWIGGDANRT